MAAPVLASQLFQRLPRRLGDEEGGKQTAQHEEGNDLHDVVQPRRAGGARARCWRPDGAQRPEDDLGDDGAHLARRRRDAVRRRPVSGGKALAVLGMILLQEFRGFMISSAQAEVTMF